MRGAEESEFIFPDEAELYHYVQGKNHVLVIYLQWKEVNTSVMLEMGQNGIVTAGDYCFERDTLRAQQTNIIHSLLFWQSKQLQRLMAPQTIIPHPPPYVVFVCMRGHTKGNGLIFFSFFLTLGFWKGRGRRRDWRSKFPGCFHWNPLIPELRVSLFLSVLLCRFLFFLLSLHTVSHLWSYFLSDKHTKHLTLDKLACKSLKSYAIISTATGPC